MIVEALLEGRDPELFVQLALIAGVDPYVLQQRLNAVYEVLESSIAGPFDRLTIVKA